MSLIADYDIVSRELRNGRLGDGTSIPVTQVGIDGCSVPVSGLWDAPRSLPEAGRARSPSPFSRFFGDSLVQRLMVGGIGQIQRGFGGASGADREVRYHKYHDVDIVTVQMERFSG